jgi:hypothetical protein
MCKNPEFVWVQRGEGHEKVNVPCRKCDLCKYNRLNDYVGRALAEASTSDWVCAVTLTYRPRDDLADKIITPPHAQAFIRSLRDRHHKIRYLIAGEYGSLRGRAHFHVLLFGIGKRPQIPNGEVWPHHQNFHDISWPHGHMFADWNADEKAMRYTLKYILKDQSKDTWMSLSKQPPLGAAFFRNKADELVRARVFPSSFNYLPPGGDSERLYYMTRTTRRDYLLRICEGLGVTDYLAQHRVTEWVQASIDKALKDKHMRHAIPETFEEMAEKIRVEQAWGQKVFHANWEEKFYKKHKLWDELENYYRERGTKNAY